MQLPTLVGSECKSEFETKVRIMRTTKGRRRRRRRRKRREARAKSCEAGAGQRKAQRERARKARLRPGSRVSTPRILRVQAQRNRAFKRAAGRKSQTAAATAAAAAAVGATEAGSRASLLLLFVRSLARSLSRPTCTKARRDETKSAHKGHISTRLRRRPAVGEVGMRSLCTQTLAAGSSSRKFARTWGIFVGGQNAIKH